MIELVTGHAGSNHIGSDDVRALNRAIFGDGNYILEGSESEVINPAMSVTIPALELMLDGRHVRIDGTDTINFKSTTQGNTRIDIVAVRYKISGGIESAELVVLEGSDPETTYDRVDYPIYSCVVDGNQMSSVTCLCTKVKSIDSYHNNVLPVDAGGTGAKNAAMARKNLGLDNIFYYQWVNSDIFKVGYINGSAVVTIPIPARTGYRPMTMTGFAIAGDGTTGSYDNMFDINNLIVAWDRNVVEAQVVNRYNGANHARLGVGIVYLKMT